MEKIFFDKELYFRFLNEKDIDILLDLINEVYEGLEDKSVYILDTYDELLEQLSGDKDVILGVFNEKDELIAFRHTELGVESKQLHKYVSVVNIPKEGTIYHGGSMVREDYRGRGLQNKTRDIMDKTLEDDDFSRFVSTISPKNAYSMRNVFKSGFALVAYVAKYPAGENKFEERFVFYKDFEKPFIYTGMEEVVDITDVERITQVISKGYVGTEIENGKLTLSQLKK
ncbi:hypothetical protein SAMN02745245_00657 [Anaerosphaera aminiphila DSM 21120]|uniref:N-acetyltransferase domain-containing protein n=1 Tax=Anaerosphaera aminiphila DSM 21120 TaxID=1120995 RepID=A0A1M5QM15_9FIRM|nr:hypothetical protein [Anaerosphaera aminiphila]SHH15048.1 hypothetical protein SAMN02745245_00657 [Anaerosphaera aminiphila DSM 21120]